MVPLKSYQSHLCCCIGHSIVFFGSFYIWCKVITVTENIIFQLLEVIIWTEYQLKTFALCCVVFSAFLF